MPVTPGISQSSTTTSGGPRDANASRAAEPSANSSTSNEPASARDVRAASSGLSSTTQATRFPRLSSGPMSGRLSSRIPAGNSRPEAGREAPAGAGGRRCGPMNVLVVDDSRVMREMIVACLRGREGLSFVHASSGLEAIEKLSLQPYGLVVLDLNMPDIGGFEVLEFIRGQDQLRHLPILVVTSRTDEESRRRALEAGASRFLTKPFTPQGILAEAAALLGGAEATA